MTNEKEPTAGLAEKNDGGLEVRYYVNGEAIYEAVKLQIGDAARWFYTPLSGYYSPVAREREDHVYATKEEAQQEAARNKAKHEQEDKEQEERDKKRLGDLTQSLSELNYYDYISRDEKRVLKKGRKFVDEIKSIYRDLPRKEKTDTEEAYTAMLEQYIVRGIINTQGLAFRPSEIRSVRYGEDGSVQLTLAEGKTVIPKSKSVTRLIKVIFGDNDDGWTYNDVEFPEGEYDTVEDAGD